MYESAALLHWGAAAPTWVQALLYAGAVSLPYALAICAALVGVATFWRRGHDLAAYVATLGLAALSARLVVVELVRLFVQTVRPYAALSLTPLIAPVSEFSFPSGHVAVLSALAFVAWPVRRSAGVALLLGALLVGFARVAAGVHWPLDVLGGVAAGAAAALVASYCIRSLHRA